MSSEGAIERVLFISSVVHVYMIPPMASGRGHVASNWTKPPSRELFVDETQCLSPRLRILERSSVSHDSTSASPKLTVSIMLESPANGELFAAAPYINPNAVMQAVDSARFFAITVMDSGRKAVLGIGFEERSEAFDFGVALQEARRILQWDAKSESQYSGGSAEPKQLSGKQDWSLKEGETLHIDVPKSSIRRKRDADTTPPAQAPMMTGTFPGLLPPPPSAADIKEERRKSREIVDEAKKKELANLGFDDGEFGEFQ